MYRMVIRLSRFEIVQAAVLMAAVAGVVLTRVEAAMAAGTSAAEPAWAAPLHTLENAVSAGDAKAAGHAWQQAYLSALGTRRWDGMLAVGDAALQIGAAGGSRSAAVARARKAYLVGLTRARNARSTDGVLRLAQAFFALGDREVAERCLDIARGLLVVRPDPRAAAQLHALAEAMGEPPLRAESWSPTDPFVER